MRLRESIPPKTLNRIESDENHVEAAIPNPPLAVVMSVFNNARFLDSAIQSILNQSFTAFELLILDDGSTDSSPAIIARHAARDSSLRVFQQPNQGLVAGLNWLILVMVLQHPVSAPIYNVLATWRDRARPNAF